MAQVCFQHVQSQLISQAHKYENDKDVSIGPDSRKTFDVIISHKSSKYQSTDGVFMTLKKETVHFNNSRINLAKISLKK